MLVWIALSSRAAAQVRAEPVTATCRQICRPEFSTTLIVLHVSVVRKEGNSKVLQKRLEYSAVTYMLRRFTGKPDV